MSETTTGPRPALVRRLAHYLRPYRLAFALALGQVFLMSALELLRPWPLKIVVDNVLGERPLPFGIAAGDASKPALLAVCVLAQVFLQGMGMMLTGRHITAAEAQRLGLVNEVVAAKDLMAAAERWAREIIECSPLSVRASKEAAMQSLHLSLEQAMDTHLEGETRLWASEDAREGPRAFAEKRKPVWKGR